MAFPAWVAVIEHVPAATSVTVLPAIVHTAFVADAKLTGKPELEPAVSGNGAVPNATLLSASNVIVCATPVSWVLCVIP